MQRSSLAALAFVAVLGTCAVARAASTDDPIAGETIVGRGVTETVQQIMTREAFENAIVACSAPA